MKIALIGESGFVGTAVLHELAERGHTITAIVRKPEKVKGHALVTTVYETKHAITSADILNDRVLPFFVEHLVPLPRILTDRGKEFKGKPEHHEYELYLQIEGIEDSKTQVRHSQTNGICERLHRTIQEEFYAVAFRKKTILQPGGNATRPRRMDEILQPGPHSQRKILLWKNADGGF